MLAINMEIFREYFARKFQLKSCLRKQNKQKKKLINHDHFDTSGMFDELAKRLLKSLLAETKHVCVGLATVKSSHLFIICKCLVNIFL